MTQQGTALAEQPKAQTQIKVGADGDGQDITILSVSQALERPGLERVESVVRIPPDYQYAIPKWIHRDEVTEDDIVVKRGSGNFVAVGDKVGLSIDGYDYLNRVLGASFILPKEVHDEHNEVKLNPIHRKDYIYLREACIWYTPVGQLVYATEDVEVDFRLAYMEARVTAKSAQPILDDNGQVQFDDNGNPMLKLSADDEMKALKEFSTSRNFGPRYAQSVARVRLMKMATGIRSLPIRVPDVYPIKMVTWRDQLTPQQRIAQVTADVSNLYGGRPDDIKPMSAEEMAEAGATGAVEDVDIDRAAVERAQEQEAETQAAAQPSEADATAAQPKPVTPGSAGRVVEATEGPQGEQQTLDDGLPPMR